MRFERLGLEFGVKLAAEKPRMVRRLNDLDVILVGSSAGDAQSRSGQNLFVVAVEFVAMAMALADFQLPIGAMSEGARFEFAGPCTQAHRAAHFVHAEKFAEFVDDAVWGLRVAFGGVGAFQSSDVASVFHGSALHAKAHAEERHLVHARLLNRLNHTLHAALTDTTWNEDP